MGKEFVLVQMKEEQKNDNNIKKKMHGGKRTFLFKTACTRREPRGSWDPRATVVGGIQFFALQIFFFLLSLSFSLFRRIQGRRETLCRANALFSFRKYFNAYTYVLGMIYRFERKRNLIYYTYTKSKREPPPRATLRSNSLFRRSNIMQFESRRTCL